MSHVNVTTIYFIMMSKILVPKVSHWLIYFYYLLLWIGDFLLLTEIQYDVIFLW